MFRASPPSRDLIVRSSDSWHRLHRHPTSRIFLLPGFGSILAFLRSTCYLLNLIEGLLKLFDQDGFGTQHIVHTDRPHNNTTALAFCSEQVRIVDDELWLTTSFYQDSYPVVRAFVPFFPHQIQQFLARAKEL